MNPLGMGRPCHALPIITYTKKHSPNTGARANNTLQVTRSFLSHGDASSGGVAFHGPLQR